MEIEIQKEKRSFIGLRISDDLKCFVDDIARRESCSQSEAVRAIITAYKKSIKGNK